MKVIRLEILLLLLFYLNGMTVAQDYEKYRRKAYDYLEQGKCDGAESYYNIFKEASNGKVDHALEQQISDCKSSHNLEQQISDCKSPKCLNFATFNVAYSVAPQWSFGGCYGRISRKSRWGWFVGIMTNFSFKGFSTDKECDADGYLKDGSRPNYSGKTYRDRFSFIGGGVYRVADPLFIKAGLGYGVRNLCWEAYNGICYRNLGYSTAGIDVSVGLQLHLNRFVVSGDLVSTNFKAVEGKVGIGLTF